MVLQLAPVSTVIRQMTLIYRFLLGQDWIDPISHNWVKALVFDVRIRDLIVALISVQSHFYTMIYIMLPLLP